MPMLDGYNAPKGSTGGNWGGAILGGGSAAPSNGGRTVIRSAPKTTVSSRSGRYSSPRSVGGGPVTPPPATPAAPDLSTYLNQDSDYQNQLAQFANNLSQFLSDATRRRGVMETDYGTSKKAMDDQKVLDLNNLEADYGARGVLRSGLYGKAVGDYNTEFDSRATDLLNKEKQGLGALDQEQQRYQSQNTLQQQAAREAAIRRRAEQFGV